MTDTRPPGPSCSEVFLLRHGRTRFNAEGQLRGRVDVPLDEVGLEEAERLGRLFAPVRLLAVFSSPLGRSLRTAMAVASHQKLPVEVDEDLADRDWGPWAGAITTDVAARFGSLDDAPGVEPVEDFVGRLIAAFERVSARSTMGPVAAVAHDAVNRALLSRLDPRLGPSRDIPQRTGCWNLLKLKASGWCAVVVDAVPDDGQAPSMASETAR